MADKRAVTIDREVFKKNLDVPIGNLSVEFEAFDVRVLGEPFDESDEEVASEIQDLANDYENAYSDLMRIRERIIELTGVKGSW